MRKNLKNLFLGLFLTRPCFNCGLRPKGPWFLLCPSCASDINFISPEGRCPLCLNKLGASSLCSDCAGRETFWDRCGAFLDYKDYIAKELFSLYKFEASLAAEKDLLQLLRPKLEALKGQNIFLLPSGKDTLSHLGFSPAERLLKGCGISAETPFIKTDRKSQKSLSAEERRTRQGFLRLKAGFSPPAELLLLDDVMTTGSTFNEGARLLKERGAHTVHIMALLRD